MKRFRKMACLTLAAAMLCAAGAPRVSGQETCPRVKPVEDTQYVKTALEMIHGAKKSIILVIYEIRYYEDEKSSPTNQMIDALVAAKKRGVDVYAVINVDSWQKQNTEENLQVSAYLRKNGVKTVTDSLNVTTHVKLLVVDDKRTLIGSHNWSYSAMEKNHEASVLIEDAATAKEFVRYAMGIAEGD